MVDSLTVIDVASTMVSVINIYHNSYNAAYNPVLDFKRSALNVSV